MRQFSTLRSKINMLKDELPTSIDRSSTISITSPKPTDDDVFFGGNDSRVSMHSESSFRTKSYSSDSEDKMSL